MRRLYGQKKPCDEAFTMGLCPLARRTDHFRNLPMIRKQELHLSRFRDLCAKCLKRALNLSEM